VSIIFLQLLTGKKNASEASFFVSKEPREQNGSSLRLAPFFRCRKSRDHVSLLTSQPLLIRFLNLTAVLPSGTVLKTRSRARKSSAGPDLSKLFIGAEGTLGVITEVTVRLAPLLPTRVGLVGFPGVKQAVEAVVEILGDGVVVQCGELFFLFLSALR